MGYARPLYNLIFSWVLTQPPVNRLQHLAYLLTSWSDMFSCILNRMSEKETFLNLPELLMDKLLFVPFKELRWLMFSLVVSMLRRPFNYVLFFSGGTKWNWNFRWIAEMWRRKFETNYMTPSVAQNYFTPKKLFESFFHKLFVPDIKFGSGSMIGRKLSVL